VFDLVRAPNKEIDENPMPPPFLQPVKDHPNASSRI